MLPFPTYAPANYQPGNQPPADAQPSPSPRQMDIARNVRHAEFISLDGDEIYSKRFGGIIKARWHNDYGEYGAWSDVDELPMDALPVGSDVS